MEWKMEIKMFFRIFYLQKLNILICRSFKTSGLKNTDIVIRLQLFNALENENIAKFCSNY